MSKRLRNKLITYAVMIILQAILIRFLADKQVIATLFSAGAREHLVPAIAALCFVGLRLFLVLFLPGLFCCEVLNWWLDRKAVPAEAAVSDSHA